LQLVARLAPQPDVRFSVRKIPASPPPGLQTGIPPAFHEGVAASVPGPITAPCRVSSAATFPEAVAVAPVPLVPPQAVKPLAPDRYRLQVTIDAETLEMFRLAQDMLGHAIPDGDPASVLRCRRHNDYEGRLYFGKRRRGGGGDAHFQQKGELVPEQVELSASHSRS
jgi:hypothetical protein